MLMCRQKHPVQPESIIMHRKQERIIDCFSRDPLVIQNFILILKIDTDTSKMSRSGCYFVKKGTPLHYSLSITE